MLNYIKLWHILLAAILIRIIVYLVLNVWVFDWNFQHPDSYLYHYTSLELKNLWSSGILTIARYPEYTNITALLYYLPIPNRLGPEILNMIASCGIVALLYYTVKNVTDNTVAPKIAALIAAFDPYTVYLSTQYLRDTLILFSVVLIVYSVTLRQLKSSFLSVVLLTALRPMQAIVFLPIFITMNSRRSLAVLLLPVVVASAVGEYVTYGVDFTSEVPIPPNAVSSVGPHIKFFSSPNLKPIACKDPTSHLDQIFNPLEYLRSLKNYLLFPNPLEAGTPVELGFAGYMIFWYTVLFIGTVGIISKPRLPKAFWLLLAWSLILGTLLAMTSVSQGAMVRWRVQLYYLMIPALVLGISYLSSYEVRKRALDIIFGLISLVVLSPVTLAIAFSLWLTQRRIIFSQERVGYQGRIFKIYKFVTMVPNSDGKALIEDNDPRVTKIGKFLRKTTLDEIPSLINVLKGDMAIVGPRPLAVWEDSECCKRYSGWNLRHEILPGMIGLAQLKTDRRDNWNKLLYDLEYTRHKQTHINDLKIFLKGITYNLAGHWR